MAAANQIAGKNDSVPPLAAGASFSETLPPKRPNSSYRTSASITARMDATNVGFSISGDSSIISMSRRALASSNLGRVAPAVPSTSAEEAYTGRGGGGGGSFAGFHSRLAAGVGGDSPASPSRLRGGAGNAAAVGVGAAGSAAVDSDDAARPAKNLSSARSTAFSALSAAAATLSALSAIDESVVSTLASNAFARSVSTRDVRAIAVSTAAATNRSVCSARSDRRSSTRFDTTNSSLSASMRARRSGSSSAPGTRTPASASSVSAADGRMDLGRACFATEPSPRMFGSTFSSSGETRDGRAAARVPRVVVASCDSPASFPASSPAA